MLKIIKGQCIHTAPGGINVYQNYIYRWLTLNSDILQTRIHRRHPEIPGLSYIKPLTMGIDLESTHGCLLGLGGAGVVHYLNACLHRSHLITVEKNQHIIDIAYRYFLVDQLKNLSVVHQDAIQYLSKYDSYFQYLIVDLSDAHTFPIECYSYNFIHQCKQVLLPQGILALNLTQLHQDQTLFRWVRQIFQESTLLIPIKKTTNVILMACNRSNHHTLLNRIKKMSCLKKLIWDPYWGCIAKI